MTARKEKGVGICPGPEDPPRASLRLASELFVAFLLSGPAQMSSGVCITLPADGTTDAHKYTCTHADPYLDIRVSLTVHPHMYVSLYVN